MEVEYKETLEDFKDWLRSIGERPEDYTKNELLHMMEAVS